MTPIEEIIPLYLADRISLDSAIQSASQTPRTPLLLTALKESRSLPRSIDTDPTTPTPDLPSPSQDKLLQLIRALDSRARAQNRDSGIALDDLISTPGYGSEAEEQYNALHVFTNEAVRDFAACFLHSGYGYGYGSGSVPSPTSARRQSQGQTRRSIRSSLFRARSETRYRDSDVNADVDADVDTFADEHADPSTDVPISSGPASGSGSDLGHRRRRSSGVEKHLYNLVSFLAFLTKEKLLLYPTVGERVVVEMVSETLYHPPSHSHLHSHSQSQSQPQSWNPNRSRNRSHTVPQDAGFDSKGKGKGKGREETMAVAVSHEPWFGFVSATGPGNEVSVTAVALWLIIMGEELYQRARMERRERRARLKSKSKGMAEGEGEGGGGGDVWTRLSEVVGREWETWTSRLQFLSLREDMGISAREHAAEAAAVMRRVYDYE